MAEKKKECFGQLANLSIRYRDRSKQHFLYVDSQKLKECDRCNLFTKCMFLKYNEVIKELIRLLDQTGAPDERPKLG